MFRTEEFLPMRGAALLVAALCMLATNTSFAQGSAWSSKAGMSEPRGGLASSVVDGKIYVIGGLDAEFNLVATTEAYDPITDTWTPKDNLPIARAGHCAVAVNGKIYAIGGFNRTATLKSVEEYDPVLDIWIAKANMPTARGGLECSVVGGKIYAMGGSDQNFKVLPVVEEYDPMTDTWSARASMPTPRSDFGSGVVGGQIYVMGGFNNTENLSTTEAYDPATNAWSTKAEMRSARDNTASATLNGMIYVIGGQPPSGGTLATVEAYDVASNTWIIKTPMPEVRLDLTAAATGGRVYAIGGVIANPPNVTMLSKVEEYDPNPSAVADEAVELPASFVLHQNYPNPFNPETTIKYEISKPVRVTLKVVTLLGHEVRVLIDEEKAAGLHEARWDGKDHNGRQVASGAFLYQLDSRGVCANAEDGFDAMSL